MAASEEVSAGETRGSSPVTDVPSPVESRVEPSGESPDNPTPVTVELEPIEARRDRTGRRRRSPERAKPGPEPTPDAEDDAHQPLFAPARRPGRRVVRVVRHVQLWSVFKVALLGGLVFYAIFLIAAGLGWSVANATGQVHHIEQFMQQVGFENWAFDGAQLFRIAALSGAVTLTAGSILITLGAAIVNLISEATGGIRFTVIEVDEAEDDDVQADERDL